MPNPYAVLSIDDSDDPETLPTVVLEAPLPQLTFPPGLKFPKEFKKKVRFVFLAKDPQRTTYHALKEEPHNVSFEHA